MSIKKLRENRATKVKALGDIQEKGENIVAIDIKAMETIGEEIQLIDDQIKAIELTRQHALANVRPDEEKKDEFVAVQTTSFDAYLRGKISFDKHKSNIQAATGSYDIGKGKELVPDEFVRILKERVLEYGMIIPELDHINTSNHGVLEYPTMDDTANSAVWLDEHGSIDVSDFATGKIELNAFKLATGVVISNELIEDSFFNIIVYAGNLMGIRMGRTLEASVINGDGVKKPLGILNTVAIAGTVKAIASVDSLSDGSIEPDDLENLITAVQPSQRAGSKFYLSDVAMRTASKWKDSTGRKLLQVLSASTDSADVIYEFGGYPMRVNAELGELAEADNPVFFGNVKNYTLRTVRSINVKASDQIKILTDETVVLSTGRFDGRVSSVNECFAKLTMIAPPAP